MRRTSIASALLNLLLVGSLAFAQAPPNSSGTLMVPNGGGASTGTGFTGCPAANSVLYVQNGTISCDAGFTKVASGTLTQTGTLSVSGAIQEATGTFTVTTAGGITAFAGLILRGTQPTLTGSCTTGTQVGGMFAGSFAATCTAGQTIIMTFAQAATVGWNCEARDRTTPADVITQTAVSTNSATLTAPAGTTASDVVQFICLGY